MIRLSRTTFIDEIYFSETIKTRMVAKQHDYIRNKFASRIVQTFFDYMSEI